MGPARGKEGRCQARAVALSPLCAHLLLVEGHASGRPGGPGALHLRRKQKGKRTLSVGLTSLGEEDQTPLSPPAAPGAMRTGFPSFCGPPALPALAEIYNANHLTPCECTITYAVGCINSPISQMRTLRIRVVKPPA